MDNYRQTPMDITVDTTYKTKQNCKRYFLHDVTCQKRMAAIFETGPKVENAPAETIMSNRLAFQNGTFS